MKSKLNYYTFSATFADESFTFRIIESSKKRALDEAQSTVETLSRKGESAVLQLHSQEAYAGCDDWRGITPGMIRTVIKP